MPSPNLEFLLVTVDLFGGLAGATSALPENNDRRLADRSGERSNSNPEVGSREPMN